VKEPVPSVPGDWFIMVQAQASEASLLEMLRTRHARPIGRVAL
jgi:hypothetical protein